MMTFAMLFLIFSDLDLSQPETLKDLGLGFPHAGFLVRIRMIVSEQMQATAAIQNTGSATARMTTTALI